MTGPSYDFSMFSVIPAEVFADPSLRGMLHEAGIRERDAGNRIALFRDARTCAALRAAPQPVRDWLRASGFGEAQSPCTLPPGVYRASDEGDRLRVMKNLSAQIPNFALPKAGSPEAEASAFKLAGFLTSLTTATPVADDWIDAQLAQARKAQPRQAANRPAAPAPRRGRGLVAAAVLLAGAALVHWVSQDLTGTFALVQAQP
jgi:hypothetical protein